MTSRHAAEKRAYAFTLLELLLVISIITILAALLVATLSRAKLKTHRVICANNGHQIVIAAHVYTGDSGDWLPPNDPGGWFGWVGGNLSNDPTNARVLIDPHFARLGPYIHSAAIWKCPSDKSRWPDIWGGRYPRVRSYSVNEAVGTKQWSNEPVDGPYLDGTGLHRANLRWRTFGRFTEMTDPPPVSEFIIADHDEYSIHDAGFAVVMETNPVLMADWPATRHSCAGMFAFGDGHTEIHKWLDPRTTQSSTILEYPIPYAHLTPQGSPENPDILWMQTRTSARAN
jgi:prepilin-type N-terminal cleavage/methylation domain-containing protein